MWGQIIPILPTLLNVFAAGVLVYFFVPKSRKLDQEDLIRNELWSKVQNLELKFEKLMMQYVELNAEYAVLKAEANISAKLDELIDTIKKHP
jgi:hypothetical protein